jgi:anti-sigma factor RsiW
MKPIEPSEISGLIDGELMPSDAERVRRALAEDEALHAQYDELATLHEDLKILATAVAFRPRISLAPSLTRIRFDMPMLIVAALILRLAMKMMPVAAGCIIAMGVLVLVIWGVVHLLRTSDHERLILSQSGGLRFW